jgi:hypothetical protein
VKSAKVTYVNERFYLSFNSSLKSAKVTYVSGRFYLGFNSSLKSAKVTYKIQVKPSAEIGNLSRLQ